MCVNDLLELIRPSRSPDLTVFPALAGPPLRGQCRNPNVCMVRRVLRLVHLVPYPLRSRTSRKRPALVRQDDVVGSPGTSVPPRYRVRMPGVLERGRRYRRQGVWLARQHVLVRDVLCSLFRANSAGSVHVLTAAHPRKQIKQLLWPYCLVRDRYHLPPVLLRPQGTGHRPTRASVPGASPAVSRDLLDHNDLPHPVLCQLHCLYQGALGHGQLYNVVPGAFSSCTPPPNKALMKSSITDVLFPLQPLMLLPTGYLVAHVWKRFIRRLPPSEYVTLQSSLPLAPDPLWTDTDHHASLYRWARTPLLELDYVSGSRDGDPEVEEEKPRTVLAKVSRHERPSVGALLFVSSPRATTADTLALQISNFLF